MNADAYARKGADLLLRTLALAPEQRRARRLAHDVAHYAPRPHPTARRVLVLSPRDWAAHVQYEAVIAQALRLRGADVRFLTCGGGLEICDRVNTYEGPPMPCRTCAKYTRDSLHAHGFDVATLAEHWRNDDETTWPEIDAIDRSELAAVRDGELPLGRLVDVPLKWFLCAANLDDDPLAGITQRAMLRSARRIARAFDRALARWQPDVIVMLSGLFLFEGIAWAIARAQGIDVVTYERAFRKETLVFSRDAPAGFYDFGDLWTHSDRPLTSLEDAELDDYLADRRRGDAFDQHWSFAEEPVASGAGRGSLAVAFTNLTWDSAVVDRDRAFARIEAWLDYLVDAFAARPDDRLVIRVHPSEVRLPMKATRDSLSAYLASRGGALPPNVEVIAPDDLTSSYPLMDAADIGLVYTSTTGLELALSGTPVIVAGDVHYRSKGFTNDASNAADFSDLLSRGLDDPSSLVVDRDAARRYAHFFWFRAPFPAVGVREPVPGLARVTVRSAWELAPGHDVDLDRICDAILDPNIPFSRETVSPGVR